MRLPWHRPPPPPDDPPALVVPEPAPEPAPDAGPPPFTLEQIAAMADDVPAPDAPLLAMPDLEALPHQQIAAYRAAIGDRIDALRTAARDAGGVQNRKIAEERLAEARFHLARYQAEMGLPDIDTAAREWLVSDQLGRQIQARLHLQMPRLGRE